MNQGPPSRSIRIPAVSISITLVVWLTTVAMISVSPNTYGIDVASGSGTFRDHCGACHILEKGITTHHGPNLYDIGRIAGTRKSDMTAAEYILESILDPDVFVAPSNRRGMPKNLATDLSPDALRNIVAFLAGRGASPDFKEIQQLSIPDLKQDLAVQTVSREEMELAERVLRERGECLQCHALYRNAEYQVFAPSLFAVGLKDPELVKESIVDPNKVVSPFHRWVNVSLASGKVVSGRLVSRTEERLTLETRGKQNELVKVDILMSDVETEEGKLLIQQSDLSAMPTGFDQLLTEQELQAVISLIGQLN